MVTGVIFPPGIIIAVQLLWTQSYMTVAYTSIAIPLMEISYISISIFVPEELFPH